MLPFLRFESIRVQQSREVKGSTMTFELWMYDTPVERPRVGGEVIFSDGSTKEFAGVMYGVDRAIGEGNRLTIYTCDCMDYTFYLDRRYVNKLYASAAADVMVSTIIDDLKAAADSDGDGDAHYNDFNTNDTAPHTLATPINPGPSIKQQRFERVLPSQALDVIAEASGMYWWIDPDKRLNFQALSLSQAPLQEDDREGANARLLVETNTVDYYNLTVGESIEGVGTKSVLRDALIKSIATETEQFVWHTGEKRLFGLERRPFSELDIISVIRTRGPLTLTQVLEDLATPTAGQVGIYVGPRKAGAKAYIRLHEDDLNNDDIITVIYNYTVSDDHEALDAERVQPLADLTGGDGIHEFVFSQASELAVIDRETLDTISDTILERKSTPIVRGQFRSLTKGWEAGQTFILSWPKEAINETVYVVNLQKTVLTPANDPNIVDNVVESVVHFSNMPRGMRL